MDKSYVKPFSFFLFREILSTRLEYGFFASFSFLRKKSGLYFKNTIPTYPHFSSGRQSTARAQKISAPHCSLIHPYPLKAPKSFHRSLSVGCLIKDAIYPI
ncbi:hypothetical protein GCWU000341_02889 [Oribacterium sp. oral taxon 078 str. F0262]|nr:hypothetical protein GCWU000341_02889 [Oribacterium sp. oral taxon 078 str. F0262]